MNKKEKMKLVVLVAALVVCVLGMRTATAQVVGPGPTLLELRTEPAKNAKVGDAIFLILKWEAPQGKVLKAHLRTSIVGGRNVIDDTFDLPAGTNELYIFVFRFGHVSSAGYAALENEVYLIDENGNKSEKKKTTLTVYP